MSYTVKIQSQGQVRNSFVTPDYYQACDLVHEFQTIYGEDNVWLSDDV